jgi:hypothetical protein
MEVAKLLAAGTVRRVPIVDKDGKVINIISQSSIIHLFNENADKLKDEASSSVTELDLGTRTVLCARSVSVVCFFFLLVFCLLLSLCTSLLFFSSLSLIVSHRLVFLFFLLCFFSLSHTQC